MPDLQCRQAGDKHGTCHGGRLRPHYASPLSSSASTSNADLDSGPNKIFAYPYFCTCSCLAFAWLPPPRRRPVPRYLAPVRRGTCTTIIAVRCLRHAMSNDQGLGQGLGFPMWSAGEISGEDGCTVHVAIRRRWWMVGLETGPPLGRCTYSPAVGGIKESLCRQP